MKKPIFVLIFSVFLVFGMFSQSANSSGPRDLVVVLDTSSSMSSSYRETSNYLIGPFLLDNLRIGDTFHLISFSGTPKLEISRRIEGSGDVETIIARLLLMYPLYPESDISAALSYAESFTSSLPNRSKKIVLISDGDAENTQNLVNDSSARFRRLGAELQYIKVPVTGNGSARAPTTAQNTQTTQPAQSGQSAQATQPTQTAPSGQATQTTQPAQTTQTTQTTQGGQAAQTTQPAQTTQSGQETQNTQATQATQTEQTVQPTENKQPSEPAQQTQSPSPGESPQTSSQAATQESVASGSTQAQAPAQVSSQAQSAQGSSGTNASSSGLNIPLPLIGLGLLLLLLLIGIIIFVSRRLVKSPNRVLAKAAAPGPSAPAPSAIKTELTMSRKPDQVSKPVQIRKTDPVLEYPPPRVKPLPKDKVYDESTYGNGGPLLLNLFVEDQNTAIGKRNIHSLKPGYSFTIGGGKSDFLIFLVPIPPRIADVSYDGRNCSFIPRKPQYFPDIGSQTIPNCIGKTFRVISDKKYELHIRLERYEDPLQALNKLLRSIKVPGPVQ